MKKTQKKDWKKLPFDIVIFVEGGKKGDLLLSYKDSKDWADSFCIQCLADRIEESLKDSLKDQ